MSALQDLPLRYRGIFFPIFFQEVKLNKIIVSNSRKKYLRKEKARIRRDVFDVIEQDKLISALYPSVRKA